MPLTSPHYPIVPTPEFKGKSGAGDYGDFVMQTDAVVAGFWMLSSVRELQRTPGRFSRAITVRKLRER